MESAVFFYESGKDVIAIRTLDRMSVYRMVPGEGLIKVRGDSPEDDATVISYLQTLSERLSLWMNLIIRPLGEIASELENIGIIVNRVESLTKNAI